MVDRRTFLSGVAGLGAVTLIGCSEDEPRSPRSTSSPPTPSPEQTSAAEVNPRVTGTVAGDLNVPWGIAFLPTSDALVAQRDAGSIVRVSPGGRVRNLGEVRGSRGGGEGGLQGLALDPDDDNVVFAFVTTDEDDRVVRIELDGDRLGDITPILTGIPVAGFHHGGRLLFDQQGHLLVATGEAGNPPESQKRGSLGGKILRIDRNGDAVDGNPFGNRTWSYGHRNVEGLAFDDEGRLWASEFGANRFDELNLIEKGKNYGWPRFEGKSDDSDYVTPKVTWTTDECSPSGLAIHRSTAFVAALRGECLWAVPLDGTDVGKPRAYFRGEYGRIRTVVVAPDDSLWMTTSNTDGRGDPGRNDDRILRVTL